MLMSFEVLEEVLDMYCYLYVGINFVCGCQGGLDLLSVKGYVVFL